MATLFNTRIADTYQGLLKTIDNGILGAGFTEISDGSGNGTSVFLNTGGDLEATGIVSFGSLKDIGENITITKFVDAADGLINNDNDTTIPTSAAIIDYVATQITLEDLDFTGDGATSGSVDLDSQTLNIIGTANEITTSAINQTLTIGLPSSVTISGTVTATTFSGDLNGTINTATTAVTQPLGDNSTKVATTAFVDRVITAQDLDFQGTTGSGSVDLDSQTLTIQGTTNEITTAATGQVLTVGLPSSISTDLVGNVTGNLTGDVTGNVTGNTSGVHTGNVVGNVTGNVTGDLTGNTTGLHTGNVTGNVTGDLNGAVTGNVTGNLTGDVTGNVTGDLTGDVTGSVTGNVTGNLTGNVTGNVTGDLTGNADTATAWATGRTISLTGEATGTTSSLDGTANVSAAVTLTNSSVIDKVLTGLQSPAGATISATDSMLVAFGKLQSQINGIAEGLQFQGSWNASTNTPTLTSSTGTQGHYYIVGVAGSTNLDGVTDWEVGDWAIFSTTGVWQRLDQTGVQGTGTTGNLTKWATGSTIADSIVSESGTALTVAGSLTTSLETTVSGNLTVGTDSLIVNSVSDAVSMAGILTVASPVINTGISGSAVLDDDTFATANATTVATSESIKAYVDAQDQGSGTVGTIPKFATSTTFNNSVITQSSNELFLGGETYIPSHQLIIGASDQNFSSEYLILDGSGTHISGNNTILSRQRGLNIGTVEAESVNIDTTNVTRLTISSGGTATFSGSLIGTSATFSGGVTIGESTALNFGGRGAITQDGSYNFTWSTNGVANGFYLESATGNVGIGTNSPEELLDVYTEGADATSILQIRANRTGYGSIRTNLKTYAGGSSATDKFTINFKGTDALTISSGGKVIVGTDTTNALEVFSSGDTEIGFSYNTHGNIYAKIIGDITNASPLAGEMAFQTATGGTLTERMRISSTGAIKNANPPTSAYALTIEGSAVGASSYGIKIEAGTNSSDRGLQVNNYYGAEQMYVKGTGGGYLNATAWSYNSDLRLKENISDVQSGIDTVLKMKPKHFDYIDGDKDNLGFIAQEIQEIIPQSVSVVNEDTGYLGLKTDFLVPYLVKAIQEQQTIIETLTARLDVLEKKA